MEANMVASRVHSKIPRDVDLLRFGEYRRIRNETSLGLDGHAHFVARVAAFLRRHRRPICVACLASSAGMGSVYFFSFVDLALGVLR